MTTETETTTATVYHITTDGEDDPRFETYRDLIMGWDFATGERSIDYDDVDVDELYAEAGTVEVDAEGRAPEAAVYSAWEDGAGHDPSSTRSMQVGDVIVVHDAGDDHAHFVDNIGFVEVDATRFTDGGDDWAEDRGLAADVDVVPATKVAMNPHAVASAWELADGVAPSVAAYVASCFATDDAGNYFGVAPRDGRFVDSDTVFEDVEGGDGATYDIHVEEKAVGIVDEDADVPGRTYKVEIPGDDDMFAGKALYVNPAQIFVDKVHDATSP